MFFFFFQAEDGIRDVAVTGVQTCALPISSRRILFKTRSAFLLSGDSQGTGSSIAGGCFLFGYKRHASNTSWLPNLPVTRERRDRKSTRLNSSHGYISYAVFCLKKKTHNTITVSSAPPLLPISSTSSKFINSVTAYFTSLDHYYSAIIH